MRAEADLGERAALIADALVAAQPSQLLGRTRRLIPPSMLALGASRGQPRDWTAIAGDLPRPASTQSAPEKEYGRPGAFRAYGASRAFGVTDFWTDESDGLLFLFHLHGFEELATYAQGPQSAAASSRWAEIIESWLQHCAVPANPAWHPYPLSERMQAWCLAISLVREWPPSLRDRMAAEIWRQGRFLARFPEYDVGGNHLLQNAIALVFAGALFPESCLGRRGLSLLRRQTTLQFLDDGGHIERSPSYHRRLVERLRQVEAVLRPHGPSPAWLQRCLKRAEGWLDALAGPDGSLPLFNDAWQTPPLQVGPGRPDLQELPDSGFVVLRSNSDQLVIDAAPLAPRHLPPHAHADALSFVLWTGGELSVADPGTYLYTGPARSHLRSTRAHSTVEVDGEDQCVFWGDFRAGFMPVVKASRAEVRVGATVVRTAHDGYRRLDDPTVHRRTFVWIPGTGVVIIDLLDCAEPHSVRSALPLAPERLDADRETVGGWVAKRLGSNDDGFEVETRDFAPRLGSMGETDCLTWAGSVAPREPFGWSLLRLGSRADLRADRLTVTRDGRSTIEIPLEWDEPRF